MSENWAVNVVLKSTATHMSACRMTLMPSFRFWRDCRKFDLPVSNMTRGLTSISFAGS